MPSAMVKNVILNVFMLFLCKNISFSKIFAQRGAFSCSFAQNVCARIALRGYVLYNKLNLLRIYAALKNRR